MEYNFFKCDTAIKLTVRAELTLHNLLLAIAVNWITPLN